jgi:exonuclease VII small subunit
LPFDWIYWSKRNNKEELEQAICYWKRQKQLNKNIPKILKKDQQQIRGT